VQFEAKALNLDLELVGLEDENGKKEERVFYPRERITSVFAEKVLHEAQIYVDAQESLPDKEKEPVYLANLKFLSWVYKEIDIKWIKSNFNPDEVTKIRNWAFQGLMGIKKDEES